MGGINWKSIWDDAGQFVQHLIPDLSGVWDLGHPQRLLRNGYFSGNVEAANLSLAGSLVLDSTITPPLTVGDQTINTATGTVNFAALATTLTVTNSLVTADSIVLAVVRTNDATAAIKNVEPTAGAFTINLAAAATAETSVGFVVIN